ncbi:MAG: hypothetical protein ACFFD6_01835 [Candidatus Thorarchaeota archaeon]
MKLNWRALRIGMILLLVATMSSIYAVEADAAWWEWVTGDVYDVVVDQSASPGMFDATWGTNNDMEYSDDNCFIIRDDHAGMNVYIYTRVAHGSSRHIKLEFDRNDFRYYGPVGHGGGISVEVKNYDTSDWDQKAYVDIAVWSATFSLSSSEYERSGGYDYTVIRLCAWSNTYLYQLHIDRAVIEAYVRIF